ncbi:MAG: 5'-deoxynucleotidase [Clostridia bacterium]|nr:5'-deoxynucleotidase [Clostridia bacterium]
MEEGNFGFFAMLDRMQNINRWGLMRNSRLENIKEHSFDVAIIAHALTVIHNHNCKDGDIVLDPYKVQAFAIYHDCTEIITGDLPTPIKYRNEIITNAYKEVEEEAANTLASLLPSFMQEEYLTLLAPKMDTEEAKLVHALVKAADRISAYLKCVAEENFGNKEFISAKETIRESIDKIGLPEVDYFMNSFVPSYGMTLDQISAK